MVTFYLTEPHPLGKDYFYYIDKEGNKKKQ